MNSPLYDQSAWQKIEPYFDQALDLDPSQRELWLTQFTTTHPEIATAVRELLVARDRLAARGFLENSAAANSALEELIGTSQTPDSAESKREEWRGEFSPGLDIAGYRLIREIGHGGMSAVWLADRSDGQLKRTVALKLPFVQSRRWKMAERFERERDILASLAHPNIACLHDAGISSTGQPYLVMQYVDGEPFTTYCDDKQRTVRERLKIFLQVLDAVQYAHTQLVLHRDLKPSNILVTRQDRAVLLDFGIAKIISNECTLDQPQTELSNRALTPDYASPEQINACPLGTASDIYSLGVLLYELLTGQRPYRVRRNSPAELENAILSGDPMRMSHLSLDEETSHKRGSTPRKLAKTFKGDLDTIVLKALKKEPRERYASITDFAHDIRNYLQSMPVSARPDSSWYRLSRFVQRHRLQVAAAAVTIVGVVAGGAIAAWQAHEAATERDRAVAYASKDEAIIEFTEMLIDEAAASEKPVTVNELLDRSEKLAVAANGDSAENRAAILEMIAGRFMTLGDANKSEQLLQRARTLLEQSSDKGVKSSVNCLYAYVESELGHHEQSLRTISTELENLKANAVQEASCLHLRSLIADRAGDAGGSLAYAEAALRRYTQVAHPRPEREGALLGVLAGAHVTAGNIDTANHYYELAQQKLHEIGRDYNPKAVNIWANWAGSNSVAGMPMRALEIFDRILDSVRQSAFSNTPDPGILHNRARALELIGRNKEAQEGYENGRQLAKQWHRLPVQVSCLYGLASLAEKSGRNDIARQRLDEASKLLGSSQPANSSLMLALADLRGRLAVDEGKFDEARGYFQDALLRKGKNRITVETELDLTELELQQGNGKTAAETAREVLELVTAMRGRLPYSNFVGLASLKLGRAFDMLGDKSQARHAYGTAVENLSNTVDDDHPALVQARELLAKN